MSTFTRVGLGALFGVAGTLAVHLITDRSDDAPGPVSPPASAAPVDLSGMQSEVDALRAAVDDLGRAAADGEGVAQAAPRTDGEAVPMARRDAPVQADRSPEEAVEAAVASIEEQMDIEDVDAEWSSWASAELTANFDKVELTGGELVDAECRSSVCRVEIDFASVDARDEAVLKLPGLASWDGEGFFQAVGEDGLGVVAYYAREDVGLPRG